MSNSWPVDVPETLWNYGRLQAQDIPQIPMMGVEFAQQFVIAFVLGSALVAYVAWDRFNSRQIGAQDFRYRVMREVEVADLGGAAALRQAYLIYLTTLLFLYVAMTFFGKLIVQTLNALKVVGIQVDSSSLQFDSPQWPLTLAFGFAGLAPLIPQLRTAEGWLFRRAYRAVGIPVRIHQTTRNLADLLDAAAAADKPARTPRLTEELEAKLAAIRGKIGGTWVHESLNGRSAKLEHTLTILAQLELLVEWTKGKRGAWPGAEVSDAVRAMEAKVAGQVDELLDGLDKRLAEKAAAGAAAKAGALPAAGAAERREKYLTETLASARELRDELIAVLAVYVERDPTYVGPAAEGDMRQVIRDPGLRELLRQADPPNLAGTGPELGVLICVLFAVPIYAIFAWQELHPLLSPQAMPGSLRVVLATAGMEALRLLSVFWFPLLAAFGVRQYYYDEGTWIARASHDPSAYAEQRLAVVGLAFVVSVICLSGVATLWAFFIAKNVSVFQGILVGGSTPFLLFYPTMAFVAVPLVWFTLIGADARAYGRSGVVYGIWSAILVVVCQASHLAFWYGTRACTPEGMFLTDMFVADCFLYYGGLDFFVMSVLAFLAAVVFGNPRPASHALRRLRLTQRGREQAAAVVALALAAALAGSAALAQEPAGKPVVTIGFRADVEPFSYKVKADGGRREGDQPLYRGFLADLCYWIFDGGDYSVVEREVTAADRFDLLRAHEIDVLCDPVTMRFSEAERVAAGTFSPIVFATGISYLRRPNRGPGTGVYIGYVENSTAAKVVEHVCEIDLFGIVPPTERGELAIMCETAKVARRLAEGPGAAGLPATDARQEAARRDWERALLRAEAAAREERISVEQRWNAARGAQQARLQKSLATWTETVAGIEACRARGTCDAGAIRARLGDRCEDLEVDPEPGQWRRTVYRFCPMQTHTELIDWFCKQRTGKRVPGLVYLGDREIILGKLQTWNERGSARCQVENESGADDLTYEPYALMVGRVSPDDTPAEAARRAGIAEVVQRRVYEFFSFSSLARAKFDTYFLGPREDRTMSRALAFLFLLNGVEEERLFTYPTDEAGAGD